MTNKEIGKAIWENINFNGSFYEENFEKWFEDCFAGCAEEAISNIDNGGCKFETGSFIEVSKLISKDGQTHNFDFDKENFIEYFGKETCFKMFTTQEDVIQDLLNFFAGALIPEEYSQTQKELFYEADREWNEIEVDAEGPNAEQDEQLDEILETYAEKIFDLM